MALIDRFGRLINYLRISVTDRCNFRCIYCMPKEGIAWKPMEEILTYEQIRDFVDVAAKLGIEKIKLTGGEPLVRRGLDRLVEMLSQIKGIKEISLTTNGSLLKNYAKNLKKAGLSRITVSLDTLKKDKFRLISRLGNLDDVFEGFDALFDAGFENSKINTVVMKGINDDEIIELVEFAISRGVDIRFIEFMPTDTVKNWQSYFVSINDVKRMIAERFLLKPSQKSSNGPAVYFDVENISVGFITPLSKNFCSQCNRIRLSSDGFIITCLGHSDKIDVKSYLKKGDLEGVMKAIIEAIENKPKEHALLKEPIHSSMSSVGG